MTVRERYRFAEVDTALHILQESASPPGAILLHFWCGADAVSEDGEPPESDFVLERQAHGADCSPCLQAYLARPRPPEESE